MIVEGQKSLDLKLGIMQPYFLPYLGYFQLLEAVDLFILYDNIQYTKKGWINRNRMLQNAKEQVFSIPIKKDSDFLNICERSLPGTFNQQKLLNQIAGAYRRAPYFAQTFQLLEKIIRAEERNLFMYIHNSISKVCEHIGLKTKIKVSSKVPINHELKNEEKVLAICKKEGASTYINSGGGIKLYSKTRFEAEGVALKFINVEPLIYEQFDHQFVQNLSILDVLMFNPASSIMSHVKSGFKIVQG